MRSSKATSNFYEQLQMEIKETFKLSAFVKSGCIIVTKRYNQGGLEQFRISRQELIQYVANKLGGAHLDLKRNLHKELERKYILLDEVYDKVQLGGKNIIYFELLSAGQCLVKSRDMEQLIGVI